MSTTQTIEVQPRRHIFLMIGFISTLVFVFIGKSYINTVIHCPNTEISMNLLKNISPKVSREPVWLPQNPRSSRKELPPLVWQYGEERHPYFLFHQKDIFNVTEMKSFYNNYPSGEKLILLYDMPTWHRLKTRHTNPLRNCPVKECRLSENKTFISKADGVVFYVLSIRSNKPPPKLANQMWVFFVHEPPWNFKYPRWNDRFNWTMTFRLDSDIVCPYFLLLPKPRADVRNFKSITKRKTAAVMWLVSNCITRSRREEYVKELTKYIKTDIYGRCGMWNCPRFGNGSCDEILNERYKFYLAFENSLCRDYITEKVSKCYALDIIPVVRGGAEYEDLLPRGTYINTADFSSPRHLAEYLTYLDKNDTAYAEILQRKCQFTVTKSESTFESSLCDLCIKLHNLERFSKTHYNINRWWYEDSCTQPIDL